jgi:HPt (histidine-containing phosphotransfer) domain-containing protein
MAQLAQSVTNEATVGDGGDKAYCDVERPLDLVHLSKYTFGDRGLETELLGLFRVQAGLYLTRLEVALDGKEWRDAAHGLKGSARGLGAWALGDIAEEIECLGFDEAALRADGLDRLRKAIEIVNAYIDQLLS